ncbi:MULTISPECIES: hypothetical protein [Pseudonocardia]|uniref:hypothetical protein n=1 Tax=Pseudonocardia TaxID=1847 RepID=UPI001AD76E16|nr:MULTISPECIES: hypothetical protein [Pseudonocardia]MBO4240375.1 hypothetical protein [Pseudonocardia alni]MCO7192562.1 hypothetical protein [Pseudonocardia sp. McavD-2-B]
MWGYEEFIAKTKLYFDRADSCRKAGDEYPSDAILWLLLGLEFLIRAPLARAQPTLLAALDGPSILHAAGFARPGMRPRSIPTHTVLERLLHIEPEFGEDRRKDALFLADLRNGELHSADAVLDTIEPSTWMPQFLDVVESVCKHLGVPATDLIANDIVEAAQAARAKNDRALKKEVEKLVAQAKQFYSGLKPDEVETRRGERLVNPNGPRRAERNISCPACQESKAAVLWLAVGRVGKTEYDEDSGQVHYTVTYLAEGLNCRVCGLSLSGAPQIVAAGIDRLYIIEHEEDRYEGWENAISRSEALDVLGVGEPDYEYGND